MNAKALIVDSQDNVAVMLSAVDQGDTVTTGNDIIVSKNAISIGHKICTKQIPEGTNVVKYGLPIGRAIRDISVGEWVHSHNVEDTTEDLCNAYAEAYFAKTRKEHNQ